VSGIGGWDSGVGCVGVDDSSTYLGSPGFFLAFLSLPTPTG